MLPESLYKAPAGVFVNGGVTDEKMEQIKSIIVDGTGLPIDICKV